MSARSLSFKLLLAFLAVAVSVSLLGVGITHYITQREFTQLVQSNARSRFIEEALTYYRQHGSWEGFPLPGERSQSAPAPGPPRPGQPPFPVVFFFVLTDAEGRVVLPAQPYTLGEKLSADILAEGVPIELDGEEIGFVLTVGGTPPYDPRELHYLQRSNRALLYAAIGSMAVALGLSLWFSRRLTRPLHELTAAIHAAARGELGQQVAVQGDEEIEALARAFNQMSHDLAQMSAQRRRMTADIAHDLRTPLTVLSGYLESMEEGILAPTPERLATLRQEVGRLQRLVEDLRTLSLADAGALSLNLVSVSPAGLLKQVQDSYRHAAELAGVNLGIQTEAALPEIKADPDRLLQVLGNLVDNALRHTPEGGRVLCSASLQDGELIFAVADNGAGIPAADLPHLFERFYRADRSRSQGQSGLGLAIARSIVEAHGGRIWVESTEGKGSVFRFSIPLKR